MLLSLRHELRAAANAQKAAFFPRFFKAGPGQYAEGDKFLGVTVPQQRLLAKRHSKLPLPDIAELLDSPWHEERLTGLLILVGQFTKADDKKRRLIYEFYIAKMERINNWDLVDSSAPYIVGAYLDNRPEAMKVLTELAQSDRLWERRIAMLATLHTIRKGRPEQAFAIADALLQDRQDLIQKAVGWMLREIGKYCGREYLVTYLSGRYKVMPRTALRYAIEHFDAQTRQKYLKGDI